MWDAQRNLRQLVRNCRDPFVFLGSIRRSNAVMSAGFFPLLFLYLSPTLFLSPSPAAVAGADDTVATVKRLLAFGAGEQTSVDLQQLRRREKKRSRSELALDELTGWD